VQVPAAPEAAKVVNLLGMRLALISVGDFQTGQTSNRGERTTTEAHADNDYLGGEIEEKPVRTATILRPFYPVSG